MKEESNQRSNVNNKPAPEVATQLKETQSENISSNDTTAQQQGQQRDYKASTTQEPTNNTTAQDKKQKHDTHTETYVNKETGKNSEARDSFRPIEDVLISAENNNKQLADQFKKNPDKE